MENSTASKDENKECVSLKLQYSYNSTHPRIIDESGRTIYTIQDESNVTQICRLCAKIVDKSTHLFSNIGNGPNLADKINSCLPITVKENDVLPKQLCSNCIQKLQECFQFSVACISAEKKFMGFNPGSSDSACSHHIDHIDHTDHPNLNTSYYSCPLCIEGTLKVVNHMINAEIDIATESSEIELSSNNSSLTVFNVHYNTSEEDARINVSNGTSPCRDRFLTVLCATSDKKDQGILREINKCNFVCRICNKLLCNIDSIYCHSKFHSRHNFFPCVLCENMYFVNEAQLESHFHFNHQLLNNNWKEMGQKTNMQNEIILTNINLSNKDNFTGHDYSEHLNEEEPSVNYNICTDISEESMLFNGYLLPDIKKVCEICGQQFSTDGMLLMHMNSAHIPNTMEETDCNTYFEPLRSSNFVQKEQVTQNEQKAFECESCGVIFDQLTALKKHKKEFHEDNYFSEVQVCYMCSECKAIFPDLSQVSQHSSFHEHCSINSISVKIVFRCEYCDLCFLRKDDLKQHLSRHVGELPYSCLQCNLYFESYNKVLEHKRAHQSIDVTYEIGKFSIPVFYVCEFCGRHFEHWQSLYVHRYKSHLHSRTFSNEDLPKKRSNSNATVQADSGRSHLCEICGKIFDSQPALTKHRKQEHPQTSKYQCGECGKVLANLTGLIIHRRLHTGEKPFVCDLCGKSFHQSSGMYTHRRTHTRECPYRCEFCDQAYNVKGDLDNHRRAKHTKERPFRCETCHKSFLTSSVFYQHRILHTGVRKYKCMYCEKSFARWNALRLHIRTHTGEKPYICDVCQRGFAQKGDMKKHMKTQHNVLRAPETETA